MKISIANLILPLAVCVASGLSAQVLLTENFSNTLPADWQKHERGEAKIENGALKIKDCLLTAGDATWRDYELTFKARAPENAEQVQIWAGLRCQSRDDRYVFGLRGGNHDDLLCWRYGYLGNDEFLAIRPLDFHPEPGPWYKFRLCVWGDQLRLFLNEETQPRIAVRDTALASGQFVLGGGWLETEFDDVQVRALSSADIEQLKSLQEIDFEENKASKEQRRREQRARWEPLPLGALGPGRHEISLDGNWLFKPDFELKNESAAISPDSSDTDWHVLHVPDFWNEHRVWLHGEDAMMRSGDKGQSDNWLQQEIKRCQAHTFDYKKTNIGYYRMWIENNASTIETYSQSMDGRLTSIQVQPTVFLHFDAVSKIAKVWVNGQFAGEHVGMFGDFKLDIGPFMRPGKNLITVKVVKDYANLADSDKVEDVAVTVEVTKKMLNDLPHGIFAKDPAGIWQPVKLLTTNPVRISEVFVKTNLQGADYEVSIYNGSQEPAFLWLGSDIKPKNGGRALFTRGDHVTFSVAPGTTETKTVSLTGFSPELWSPEHPNLYDLTLNLTQVWYGLNGQEIARKKLDTWQADIGFRTFEVRGDYFYLNNKQYWIRGANHTPMSLRPNDAALADSFLQKMHAGNMLFTRTTTAPFSETWMKAADRQGVAVSYEGAFPWLMMRGDIPDKRVLDFWKKEMLDLVRKYRNHPSLLMWTLNNEMKFYEKDENRERVRQKFDITTQAIQALRQLDPTRPVIFDSGYRRDTTKFDWKFMRGIDDGDADDVHSYFNWYYFSIFDCFDNTFTKWYKNPGRPLISQEFSSGYPSNDAGHVPRFYTFSHYVPQALLGRWAYEDHDPRYFLERQAFIAKESGEGIRRSTPTGAGLQHFSSVTWFRDVFDARSMKPYPAYKAVQLALQPVLVSAELWGRHFYAGERFAPRVCVVNDLENGEALPSTIVRWSIDYQGNILLSGEKRLPALAHYGRLWDSLDLRLPATLPAPKIKATLRLTLLDGRKTLSRNEYELLLAQPDWVKLPDNALQNLLVYDPDKKLHNTLQRLGQQQSPDAPTLDYKTFVKTIKSNLKTPGNPKVYLIEAEKLTDKQLKKLKKPLAQGAVIILLNAGKHLQKLFPQAIDSIYKQKGEMIQLRLPESPVFEGLDPHDLAWFNNGRRERPLACQYSYYAHRQPDVDLLAQFTVVHGYINPAYHKRHERVREFTGFPLMRLRHKAGTALLCSLLLEHGAHDPLAGRLLRNMVLSLQH